MSNDTAPQPNPARLDEMIRQIEAAKADQIKGRSKPVRADHITRRSKPVRAGEMIGRWWSGLKARGTPANGTFPTISPKGATECNQSRGFTRLCLVSPLPIIMSGPRPLRRSKTGERYATMRDGILYYGRMNARVLTPYNPLGKAFAQNPFLHERYENMGIQDLKV